MTTLRLGTISTPMATHSGEASTAPRAAANRWGGRGLHGETRLQSARLWRWLGRGVGWAHSVAGAHPGSTELPRAASHVARHALRRCRSRAVALPRWAL